MGINLEPLHDSFLFIQLQLLPISLNNPLMVLKTIDFYDL